MPVRTPWWLNLLALAAALGPCLWLGLPWYVAGPAALATGTASDRAWRYALNRRSRERR
ncbi:hypothetical protein CFP65_7340 [Kitasatospora sp. MMS16-BH015]|uniref:hypothetical protein n=1 Tax=Kitasatospora sp. MMS16-BH015 TaxID=2018025 RepID=UPI000CA31B36|nr:hypothetical protein [Kitasatospora sp. MMS16-BH015]AUG81924.1 hypothetical protein CFP65_7340 [Kitasatospora sp. MMS16-BH015]